MHDEGAGTSTARADLPEAAVRDASETCTVFVPSVFEAVKDYQRSISVLEDSHGPGLQEGLIVPT